MTSFHLSRHPNTHVRARAPALKSKTSPPSLTRSNSAKQPSLKPSFHIWLHRRFQNTQRAARATAITNMAFTCVLLLSLAFLALALTAHANTSSYSSKIMLNGTAVPTEPITGTTNKSYQLEHKPIKVSGDISVKRTESKANSVPRAVQGTGKSTTPNAEAVEAIAKNVEQKVKSGEAYVQNADKPIKQDVDSNPTAVSLKVTATEPNDKPDSTDIGVAVKAEKANAKQDYRKVNVSVKSSITIVESNGTSKGLIRPKHAIYDLNAIFNVNSYLNYPNISINATAAHIRTMRNMRREVVYAMASLFPKSVISLFAESGLHACGDIGPETPYVPSLRAAVASIPHLRKGQTDLDKDATVLLARRNTTLTVELTRPAHVAGKFDRLAEADKLLKEVRRKLNTYHTKITDLLLVSGNVKLEADAISAIRKNMRDTKRGKVFVHKGGKDHDLDLYILASAAHLFARGPVAALSNLHGVVTTSSDLHGFVSNNEFRWALGLDGGSPMAPIKWNESQKQLRAMGEIKPSCCTFRGYGRLDGEKVVCENALLRQIHNKNGKQEKCWILSIGCQNKWSFEADVYNKTHCKIHVFDCTGDFTVPKLMQKRVSVHKYCVGPKNEVKGNVPYRTMESLIRIGSKKAGFEKPTAPVLAKLDVEGWEIPSLRTYLVESKRAYGSSNAPASTLPRQILLEMHSTSGTMYRGLHPSTRHKNGRYEKPEWLVEELFRNITAAGYDLVYRADNPYCLTCSEVNLLHRDFGPVP